MSQNIIKYCSNYRNELLAFVLRKHDSQYRKDNITPYIIHPLRVSMDIMFNFHYRYKSIALAHDLLEDTDCTILELKQFFNLEDINALRLLTKMPHQNYNGYIRNIKKNTLAKKIKIADIEDNLNDSPSDKQTVKYVKALEILGVRL